MANRFDFLRLAKPWRHRLVLRRIYICLSGSAGDDGAVFGAGLVVGGVFAAVVGSSAAAGGAVVVWRGAALHARRPALVETPGLKAQILKSELQPHVFKGFQG